jgi:L-seryl-tRNA(Ser) seleniumtransferase
MTFETDPFDRWGLTPLINVSGTMTSIGASRVRPEVIQVVSKILDRFVSMDELQSRASGVIANATGAEAGCVTGCSASAITQGVAAAVTGCDLAAIEELPDTGSLENRVVIQRAHMINYGAPVHQAIALAGAQIVPLGTSAQCETWHLRKALEQGCAAAVYVVSHHTVREGELPMGLFVSICHEYGVPVIADMASEYDLLGPIGLGCDLAIYSGHKFLSGITSGIVAGRLELVRATYLQHRGLGRTMKAGKECVAGAMAALELWAMRDAAAVCAREQRIVKDWLSKLETVAGFECSLHEDWTGNPITRLRVVVDPEPAGLYAWELADRLSSRSPKIIVRDDLIEHGEIYLDPCNVDLEEAELAACAIVEETAAAKAKGDGLAVSWSEVKQQRAQAAVSWPVPKDE